MKHVRSLFLPSFGRYVKRPKAVSEWVIYKI